MDRKIRAGVIGIGAFGSLHAKVYAESEFAELVAVADLNQESLSNFKAGEGVDRYEDYRQLKDRDDIDVVNVCTTDRLHLEPVLGAAAAGKHVLVEKPLACTVKDCDAMIQATADAGVKLMVGQILRFDPRYCVARKAIAGGEIGELVHLYARRNNSVISARARANKTSVLFFLGVHDIYFANWCVGAPVKTVFGLSHKKVLKDLNTPDTTMALLEYENGTIASLEFSWVLPANIPSRIEARFEAVGTAGQINIDGGNPTLEMVSEDGVSSPDTAYAPELEGCTTGVLRDEISHFVDCVRNDREPAVTGVDGRETERVVCAINESIQSGRPVQL